MEGNTLEILKVINMREKVWYFFMNCLGALFLPNGDKLEGEFKEGKFTGKGKFLLKNFV